MSDTGDGGVSEKPTLPRPDDIKRRIGINAAVARQLEDEFKRRFSARSAQSEEEYAHLKGVQDHYRHKEYWSYFLMFIVASLVIFQIILLLKVGKGFWNFENYPYLIPALLVQNFAAILGLARFVVRSLFSQINTKPPK